MKKFVSSLICFFLLVGIFPFSHAEAAKYDIGKYENISNGYFPANSQELTPELAYRDQLEVDAKIDSIMNKYDTAFVELFIDEFNNFSQDIELIYEVEDNKVVISDVLIDEKRNVTLHKNALDQKETMNKISREILQYRERTLHEEKLQSLGLKPYSEEELDQLTAAIGTSAIRAYFERNRYWVALAFFNHTLVKNPSDLHYNTEGDRSDRIAVNMAQGLYDNNFVSAVAKFGRAGTNESNKANQDIIGVYFTAFNYGDLKFAIHGVHNLRFHRMWYERTYFRIYDVYDFTGEITFLLNMFTSGTTPYKIYIGGLVLGDTLQ